MSVEKLWMTQNGRQSNEQFFFIADKLLEERKYVVGVKNNEYCSDSVKMILSLMKFLIERFRIVSKL